MNYLDFLHTFIDFEENNNLFELKYFNRKFWQYVRYNIFDSLRASYFNAKIVELGFNEKADLKESEKDFKTLLKSIENTELLIFNHPRRSFKNDVYVNVHTDYLAEQLKKTFNVKILEEPFFLENRLATIQHFTPCYFSDTFYTDSIENVCGAKIREYKLKKSYVRLQKYVSHIVALLKGTFEKINTDLVTDLLLNQILYLKYSKKLYIKLLSSANAKAIVLFYSPSHTKCMLCEVGKELNIPTIDLEHGMQTEYDPFFYVLKNKKRNLETFPDMIFAFGENTVNTTHYAEIISKNIYPVGNYNLETRYNELLKIEKPTNIKNILFISQTVLGQDLKEYAKQLAELLKDNDNYHIIYKLHPFEDENDFKDCAKFKNITVVSNSEKDINYLQKISYCQIGVFSTALYEGIKFMLPTFIANKLYGAEFTKDILKNIKSVKYIDSVEELYNAIISENIIKATKQDVQLLWKDNALENIVKYLKEIINGRYTLQR